MSKIAIDIRPDHTCTMTTVRGEGSPQEHFDGTWTVSGNCATFVGSPIRSRNSSLESRVTSAQFGAEGDSGTRYGTLSDDDRSLLFGAAPNPTNGITFQRVGR